MPKNIVVLTNDAGPSNGLQFVVNELKAQGHIVSDFLGKGKGLDAKIENKASNAMLEADFVLFGISSTPETWVEEVNLANIAKATGKPYGFFCCNWGEFRRPAFASVMKGANLLFTVDEADAKSAKDFVGKDTLVVPSGNPAWADYFNSKMSREEARAKLGVDPDAKILLVNGSKESVRNIILWFSSIEATKMLRMNIKMFISIHPGDPSPTGTYDMFFKSNADHAQKLPTGISTSQALNGVDLLISSISLVGVEAACLRKPVTDFVTPLDEMWWGGLSGSKDWKPAKDGASVLVRNIDDLVSVIDTLNYGNNCFDDQIENQERVFQRENVEGSAKRIVDEIVKTLAA